MSIFIEKDGKILLPGLIYIKILVFLGLITISAVLMQPVQAGITESIQHIRGDLIKKVEDVMSMELQYSSIRPAFFNSLDIRNLKLIKEKEVFLSISRIRMHFSIPQLLFRHKTFIHKIQIDRPVFSIDMERDGETLEYLISLIRTDDTLMEILRQIASYLPNDVDLLIRHCNLSVKNKNNFYKFDNLNLNIWGNDGEIFIAGRFLAELKLSDISKDTILLNSEIGINAVCADTLDQGSIDISLYHFDCSSMDGAAYVMRNSGIKPLFSVLPSSIIINYKDDLVTTESKDGKTGNGYLLQYNTETSDFLSEVKFNNFHLGDIIRIYDQSKQAEHLMKLQITGDAFYKSENESKNYNVKIKSNNVSSSVNDLVNIDFYGNEKLLNINDFNIKLSPETAKAGLFQGGVYISGNMGFSPLKPEGTIVLDKFSLSGSNYARENISAAFNVKSGSEDIHISSGNITIAQSQLNDMNLFLYPSQNETALSFSALFGGIYGDHEKANYTGGEGSVYLDAVYNNEPRGIEASLVLSSVAFFDIAEILRPFTGLINVPASGSVLKNSAISAEIFFSSDFNNIILNAPNILFDINGSSGMLSLSATDRQMTISEGSFNIADNELQVSADVVYSNPMDVLFSVKASYLDIAWNIEGQVFDKKTLVIHDPNGLNVYGDIEDTRGISGYIEGTDFPIPAKSQIVYLNFFINMRFNSMSSWEVSVDHITARDQNASEGTDFVKISGYADQDGASFREIVFLDSAGMLTGSADAAWDDNFSYIDFIVNFTDGTENGELYSLQGKYKDEQISIQAYVSDIHVNRFLKDRSPMLLTAEADITWDSIDSFNAKIHVEKLASVIPQDYLRASVDININNDELLINDLSFDIAGLKTFLPLLQITCSRGKAVASANLNGVIFNRNLKGDINFDIDFQQIDSWFEIEKAFNKFEGIMHIDNIEYNDKAQDPFNFVFSKNMEAISVTGGIREMLRLEMDGDGNFFAGLSSPLPVHGSFAGTFKKGMIDAKCNNFYFDLAALWSLMVRLPDFIVNAGYLSGAVDIRGPVWNPEFFGSVRGTSLRFQVPNFISEDIRPVPFNITAQGYEMSFGPVVAAIGTGGGTVDGWFLFENWRPVNVGLDISVPRDTPIPYDINIFGFLANGTTSGNINFGVDAINKMIELSGDLFSNNAELGIKMEDFVDFTEVSNVEIPMYSMINLKITLGSTVEFVWPSSNPILRANPEIGTVVYVSSDNRAGQFSINSNVKIRSGEVFYFDRSFYIRQGNIQFRENEMQFNPIFSARAEIRDRADSGPVTISMIVNNQPLLSFEPRFEASPALSQLEIYSILGQNLNTIQNEEESGIAQQRFLLTSTTDILTQVISTSDVFGQLVFMRRFERRVRDFLRLDMFSVRTRFLQNAVVTGAAGFTDNSDNNNNNNMERRNRVGNYFDNTTVFIGKYIGQNMFIQGMLTMRYDENSALLGGITFEPDIGIELQSPFINIRWDFIPSYQDKWWLKRAGIVADNSFTLTWSKSF